MSLLRAVARVALGVAMVGAGVMHLGPGREEFRAQVPGWFPVQADLTVLVSGVAEITLGLAFIALPRRRRLVGALLAAFLVVIFPGNVAQYLEGRDAFGLDTDRRRLVRLFFQPVLVLWALFGGGWFRRAPREAPAGGHPTGSGHGDVPPAETDDTGERERRGQAQQHRHTGA